MATKAEKKAKLAAAASAGDIHKPVGNFPSSPLDVDDEDEGDPNKELDSEALTYLADPQGFLDAFVVEAQAKGIGASNIHIALDALKAVLGVASTVVPGVGIGVTAIDAVEKVIPVK